MATVRPGRCPVRGVRMRGRLGFGALRAAHPTAAFTLKQRGAHLCGAGTPTGG